MVLWNCLGKKRPDLLKSESKKNKNRERLPAKGPCSPADWVQEPHLSCQTPLFPKECISALGPPCNHCDLPWPHLETKLLFLMFPVSLVTRAHVCSSSFGAVAHVSSIPTGLTPISSVDLAYSPGSLLFSPLASLPLKNTPCVASCCLCLAFCHPLSIKVGTETRELVIST